MVLICPFIMKIYYRLLLHVIFYFKIDNITGKSRFQGKATLVSVAAGYRNTMYIYENTVNRCGKYAHISRWVGHCSVCRDAHYVVSQSLIVSVHTDICKLSLEIHFLYLAVNMIVIIDIGVKELLRQMIVYTELRSVVFGCCGVVL